MEQALDLAVFHCLALTLPGFLYLLLQLDDLDGIVLPILVLVNSPLAPMSYEIQGILPIGWGTVVGVICRTSALRGFFPPSILFHPQSTQGLGQDNSSHLLLFCGTEIGEWRGRHYVATMSEAIWAERLPDWAFPWWQMVQTILGAACVLDGMCVSWLHLTIPSHPTDRDSIWRVCSTMTEHVWLNWQPVTKHLARFPYEFLMLEAHSHGGVDEQ